MLSSLLHVSRVCCLAVNPHARIETRNRRGNQKETSQLYVKSETFFTEV